MYLIHPSKIIIKDIFFEWYSIDLIIKDNIYFLKLNKKNIIIKSRNKK